MSHLHDHVADFVDTLMDGAEDPDDVLDALRSAIAHHENPPALGEPDAAAEKVTVSIPAGIVVDVVVAAGTDPDEDQLEAAVIDQYGERIAIDMRDLGFLSAHEVSREAAVAG